MSTLHKALTRLRWQFVEKWLVSVRGQLWYDAAFPGFVTLDVSLKRMMQFEKARYQGKHRITLFVDLSTFYESIAHDRLVQDAERMGFLASILLWVLHAYKGPRILSCPRLCVRFCQHWCAVSKVLAGVPQGPRSTSAAPALGGGYTITPSARRSTELQRRGWCKRSDAQPRNHRTRAPTKWTNFGRWSWTAPMAINGKGPERLATTRPFPARLATLLGREGLCKKPLGLSRDLPLARERRLRGGACTASLLASILFCARAWLLGMLMQVLWISWVILEAPTFMSDQRFSHVHLSPTFCITWEGWMPRIPPVVQQEYKSGWQS